MRLLRVASCQFSVEADVDHNRRAVLRQIEQAAAQDADVVHFSECALSGYLGVDVPDVKAIDWDRLKAATEDVMAAAEEHGVWVLLGSTHRLTGRNKPHNCVYVIDDRGRIFERYDKRFCTGTNGRKKTLDLIHYSPGNRACVFTLKGVKCGVLICYDYRFPELYRELHQLGVQVVFQSFHNARQTTVADPAFNPWKTVVPSTMSCRAAENHFWISATNSSTRPSMWPSFTVRPDGLVTGKLKLHRPGVLITEMDVGGDYFDAPGPWRASAITGRLHSGDLTDDPRSADVCSL